MLNFPMSVSQRRTSFRFLTAQNETSFIGLERTALNRFFIQRKTEPSRGAFVLPKRTEPKRRSAFSRMAAFGSAARNIVHISFDLGIILQEI